MTAHAESTNSARLFRAAALVVAVGVIGWLWYSQLAHRQPQARAADPAKAPAAQAPCPPGSRAVPPRPQHPATATPEPDRTAPGPVQQPKPAPPVQAAPAPAQPAQKPPAQTAPATPVPPATTRVRPQSPTVTPGASPPKQTPPKQTPVTDVPLLNEPLPQISTILASGQRPFAMIGGRVVTVGDRVGQRVVTAIEPRAVVFREPSGVQIRVGLGGRFVGVKRHI